MDKKDDPWDPDRSLIVVGIATTVVGIATTVVGIVIVLFAL